MTTKLTCLNVGQELEQVLNLILWSHGVHFVMQQSLALRSLSEQWQPHRFRVQFYTLVSHRLVHVAVQLICVTPCRVSFQYGFLIGRFGSYALNSRKLINWLNID